MIYFKSTILAFMCFTTSSCAVLPSLGLDLTVKTQLENAYILKRTLEIKDCTEQPASNPKYVWWGFSCNFKPGQIPDKITIIYAKWLPEEQSNQRFYGTSVFYNELNPYTRYYDLIGREVSKEQWIKQGQSREFAAVDNLPTSAWHTYTINVKDIMKKYRGKLPPGSPNGHLLPRLPAIFPPAEPTEVNIQLFLHPQNDSIKIEDSYQWKYPTTVHPN